MGGPPFDLRQGEEVVGVLQQRIAQLGQAAGALVGCGGGPRPFVEGFSRGPDRGVDVVEVCVGSLRDRFLGGRRDVVVATAAWLDPVPADVERVVVNQSKRIGHTGSSLSSVGQHMVYTCRTNNVNHVY